MAKETNSARDGEDNELTKAHAPARPNNKNTKHDQESRPKRAMKRLNLNLPESLYRDIEKLAQEESRTMADVLRLGLGLAHLVASERKKGAYFAIVDASGQLHRVILPY